MSEQFIQEAVKHPGSLHRFAKKHRALNRDGTINLDKATAAAEKEEGAAKAHRLRQINLARTLRELRANR